MPAGRWSVYIIRCRDGSLYTGIAIDVSRRLAEHRDGGQRCARYLRGRGSLELVLERAVGSRSLAQRVERLIKALSKKEKEKLIDQKSLFDRMLDRAETRASEDPAS